MRCSARSTAASPLEADATRRSHREGVQWSPRLGGETRLPRRGRAAQEPVVNGSFGVVRHEGALHGLGPDYSARFAADGVTFTPALGAAVAEPATLRVSLVDVRRGRDTLCARQPEVAPDADGNQVRYRHSADIVELHDVCVDGIEQSFVFATRPPGQGDLVVRCAIATTMSLASAGDDGVRFEHPGAGGVAFGAVTGIDAAGARCRGSLRCDGTTLEMALPASFVDSATYPLVLDPLIGSSFLIANIAGGSDVQPSIAYSHGAQRHLVVWSVPMSATTAEIRAQFVTSAGFLGPQTLLSTTATPGVRPAVAFVNRYYQFVLAWAGGSVASVVLMHATTGAQTGPMVWSQAPALVTGLALGGDIRSSIFGQYEDALCVVATRNPTTAAGSVRFRTVYTDTFLATLGPVTTVYGDVPLDFGAPAAAKHVGPTFAGSGRWVCSVGWRNQANPSSPGLTCFSVDTYDGTLCDYAPTSWTTGSGSYPLHTSVAVVGDGDYLVACQASASTIALRRGHATGSCQAGSLTLGLPFDPTGPGGSDDLPEVDFTGDRYVLVWRHATATTPNVKAMSVGVAAGAGAEHYVSGPSSSPQYDPAVVALRSGGDSFSDEALILWASAGIRARQWEATTSGGVTNLGGACGTIGLNDFASYGGTPVIGGTFTVSLVSPTAPVLGLIVGFSANPFACGPCTIVPTPDVLLGGGGTVAIAVPLEASLIGATLVTQWLQWRQAGCALLPDFGFSNALSFTIGE